MRLRVHINEHMSSVQYPLQKLITLSIIQNFPFQHWWQARSPNENNVRYKCYTPYQKKKTLQIKPEYCIQGNIRPLFIFATFALELVLRGQI